MTFRDRLRNRQLPQATIGIRIDWSPESYSLHSELERAEQLFQLAAAGSHSDVDEVRAQFEAARAKVTALYEYLTVKALPAPEMERLVSDHPPTPAQVAEDPNITFNRDTFFPALLAACVEGPETPEEWAQMIHSGELVTGEVNTLIGTAMELNDRSPSVSLGKGSTTTPS